MGTIPPDAEPLISLEIRRKDGKGRWLTTLHTYPARVAQLGNRFFISKPGRGTSPAPAVIEIDAEQYLACIERFDTPRGAAVVLTVFDEPGPEEPAGKHAARDEPPLDDSPLDDSPPKEPGHEPDPGHKD